ncbi:MAG: hypothetical protein Q9191_006968 [Dirinaria sp. TL-2023a]
MSIASASSGLRTLSTACYVKRSGWSLISKSQRWSLENRQALATAATPGPEVPFRKQLKDEARQRRLTGDSTHETLRKTRKEKAKSWQLTVGIEVHAQLNTERKLFSRARTSIDAEPNTHVAYFDLAYPGSQPEFQKATLIPALRAAIALNCNIQRKSSFDRKHYFYPDQPAGYQITQYYEPFAKDGSIVLYDHDGIAPEDGKSVTIGIKQIQMEQDTAKTIQQAPSTILLDFNRVSHPLIEIITLPQIHSPQTAAACVKKIQALLETVNAVTTGMEMGGLRADINVSVRPLHKANESTTTYTYHGVGGLGQRTEIKNLSSFKAIEEAIVAERDRQIEVLESGGVVEGETRGWSLGSSETTRLRGKEGEVDYRYMPDPDLGPVIISQDLIDHISSTLPELPDQSIHNLTHELGLQLKDAKIIVASDNGEQLQYFDKTLSSLIRLVGEDGNEGATEEATQRYARLVANWIVHELPGIRSTKDESPGLTSFWSIDRVLHNLVRGKITAQTAKKLLMMRADGDRRDIDDIIKQDGLELRQLSRETYMDMAQSLIGANQRMVEKIKKGQAGKLKWFVGQMMKQGGRSVDPEQATKVLEELLEVRPSNK